MKKRFVGKKRSKKKIIIKASIFLSVLNPASNSFSKVFVI